jgi:hypothetical protein
MRFLERRARLLSAQRQQKVGPAKPAAGPWGLSGLLGEEVEPPFWVGLQSGAVAQAVTAKSRAVRQLNNAGA